MLYTPDTDSVAPIRPAPTEDAVDRRATAESAPEMEITFHFALGYCSVGNGPKRQNLLGGYLL